MIVDTLADALLAELRAPSAAWRASGKPRMSLAVLPGGPRTGKTLQIDLRQAIESLGLRHVLEQVDIRRVIEEVRIQRALHKVGIDRLLDEVAIQRVLNMVS